MPFNITKADQSIQQISIGVFGGLVSEQEPEALPDGVSPDNAEMVYIPGSAATRPAFQKVLTSALTGNPNVPYGKTYIAPDGAIYNLYFDSNGVLWVEDVINSPGTATNFYQSVSSGTLAKSVTVDGREYIAISDGLHGQDVPLQFVGNAGGYYLDRVTQDGPGVPPLITNTILAPSVISTISRGFATANIVEVTTSTFHNFQPGYQVQISGLVAALIANITTIVVNNEQQPGIATITTAAAHGLAPNTFVYLSAVPAATVGTTISAANRQGYIVQITTSAPHGLTAGANISIAGTADASFNVSAIVSQIIDPNNFLFYQSDAANTALGAGGTVHLNWPIQNPTTNESLFEVVAAPTSTTFQIALSYSDGTWSGGSVLFGWDGTFQVLATPTSSSFTYQQYGPVVGTTGGTATPWGQASPGVHQFQVLYLTRNGAITAPSPPALFTANGGQYLTVSDIPIGPSNVIARILAFTGAGGSQFFYIPVPAQENGQLVSTSTVLNDNTTTSILLDFSDNTLFQGIDISAPQNTLANQIVLEGALGFGDYASRLHTYGQRNIIDNMLNMSFDGGYAPSTPNIPSGWTVFSGTLALVLGHILTALQITIAGLDTSPQTIPVVQQSMYQDYAGAPIAVALQNYRLRCLLKSSAVEPLMTVQFLINSATSGPPFNSVVNVLGSNIGTTFKWFDLPFSTPMPATIISDFIFRLNIIGHTGMTFPVSVVFDEISIVNGDSPYRTGLFGSYVNNPEGMDGVTGDYGPNDSRQVMDMGIIRQSLYFPTQDPGGHLFQTSDNGVSEPSGWQVNEVASSCGTLSAFCLTKSQANDNTSSGGEEWFSYVAASGPQIFGGSEVWKICQEIQPDWTGNQARGFAGIDFTAATTIWGLFDPIERVIYFGIPSLDVAGGHSAPNRILPVDCKELSSAYAIANSPAVHVAFSGRLVATDNTRKWTRWNRPCAGAAQMMRSKNGNLQTVLFSGNGALTGSSFGNGYVLNATKLTDDDYGQIAGYYVTAALPSRELEQALALGSGRKMIAYATAFIQGTGIMTVSYLCNTLANIWPYGSVRTMSPTQDYDMEFTGSSAQGQRIFVKFASTPASGTDNGFRISKAMIAMKQAMRLPIRGTA